MSPLHKYNNREDGFTLIELLIVVLIIGVLAAIAIPVYLGLQNQAKNNSTKQDVNSTVHTIQVALTEGQDLSTALANNSDSGNRSDGNNVVATPALDGSKNYTVVGTQKDTNFTYTYDSKTGQFTEGSGQINLGGSAPNPATVAPVINTTILPDVLDGTPANTTLDISDPSASVSITSTATCITNTGPVIKYNCVGAGAANNRGIVTVTATNAAGATTKQFAYVEAYTSSAVVMNNYDFNTTGASDWSNVQNVASIAQGTAPDGRQAMAVTPNGATAKLQLPNTPKPSGTYNYSAYFYLPAGATAKLCLYYNNSTEFCSDTTASTDSKWVPVSGALGMGQNNTPLTPRIVITGAAGKTVYVDDVRWIRN